MSNSMISLVLLCFVAGEVFGLTTNSCGSSKECFSLPPNCIVPNCNVLVTWRYNPNNMKTVFDFQATASAGWVAFGLNSEKTMIGTQGVLCHRSGYGGVRAFDLTAKPPPKSDYSGVLGNTNVQIINGKMNCSYERDTHVANQRSLDQTWYLITAWGSIYNGTLDIPLYHGSTNRASMSTKVKFPSKPSSPSSSTYHSVSVGLMIASFSAILAQVLM